MFKTVNRRILPLIVVAACLLIPQAYTSSQVLSENSASSINRHQSIGDPFLRTELFFGTAKPDGTVVTPEEFQQFLDQEITPRFPDGLTLLSGLGQFRGSNGIIVQEKSMLLILLYPVKDQRRNSPKIELIREAYKRAFQQESVLRADSGPELVSF